MMKPTIHLNGTSKATLLEDWEKAHEALTLALRLLCQAAPNGRDYYPQGPDAIHKAQIEHTERVHRVRSVIKELEELSEAIAFS
jgi:hypothetical protein